jgi:hypothetical protein
LTGETTVPAIPVIKPGSMQVSAQLVSFTIQPDTSTHLYDVYIISSDTSINKRIVPLPNQPSLVEIKPGIASTWQLLMIYAYDRNLSIYYSTSTNSFFNFNTYRPAITTVKGGYGCFGSLNFLEVKLQ